MNRNWEKLGVVPPSAVPMLNTVDAGKAGIGAPVIPMIAEPLSLMIESRQTWRPVSWDRNFSAGTAGRLSLWCSWVFWAICVSICRPRSCRS